MHPPPAPVTRNRRHPILAWIILAAIVCLGIVWKQYVYKSNTGVTPVPIGEVGDSSVAGTESTSASLVPRTKTLSIDMEHKQGMSREPPTNDSKRPVPRSESDGNNSSAAKLPFRISPSVESACRSDCKEVHDKLLEFFTEARDPIWASEMELLIEKNVISEGRDRSAIRAIECRISLCAVETVSPNEVFSPRYPDPMFESLSNGIAPVWGYETDASGVRILVTVTILVRR